MLCEVFFLTSVLRKGKLERKLLRENCIFVKEALLAYLNSSLKFGRFLVLCQLIDERKHRSTM